MKFNEIQQKLKAPKNQFNSFGNYAYRSAEDILEAVKPLLGDAYLTISDEIVEVGGRIYVKATATFVDGDFKVSNTAYAREPESKKGMDESQITGATSSYARKYALNGLFLIDDVKDADTMDNRNEGVKKPVKNPSPNVGDWDSAVAKRSYEIAVADLEVLPLDMQKLEEHLAKCRIACEEANWTMYQRQAFKKKAEEKRAKITDKEEAEALG